MSLRNASSIFSPLWVFNAANEAGAVDSQVVGIMSKMEAATPIDKPSLEKRNKIAYAGPAGSKGPSGPS